MCVEALLFAFEEDVLLEGELGVIGDGDGLLGLLLCHQFQLFIIEYDEKRYLVS